MPIGLSGWQVHGSRAPRQPAILKPDRVGGAPALPLPIRVRPSMIGAELGPGRSGARPRYGVTAGCGAACLARARRARGLEFLEYGGH